MIQIPPCQASSVASLLPHIYDSCGDSAVRTGSATDKREAKNSHASHDNVSGSCQKKKRQRFPPVGAQPSCRAACPAGCIPTFKSHSKESDILPHEVCWKRPWKVKHVVGCRGVTRWGCRCVQTRDSPTGAERS